MSLSTVKNPFAPLVAALSIDAILGGAVKVTQPKAGYRVAIDPILLSGAVQLLPHMTILDVGCGVGAAGLCVLARAQKNQVPLGRLTGVDCQKIFVELARDNIRLNNFDANAQFLICDIAEPVDILAGQIFDCVISNPPFLSADSADPSPDASKTLSNIESTADLSMWIKYCARKLKPNGEFTMIHRADRMAEICHRLMECRLNNISILPLLPKLGDAAKRIIIQARAHTTPKTTLLSGHVMHNQDGSYTALTSRLLQGDANFLMLKE